MSIQVNIFSSGSVPTATELANFISELNTDLDSIVTLNTEQVIEGVKTFWGSKMLKFKQKITADKLGFTFYDNQGKEVGNFEYDNKNNFRLLALGNYYSATNQEIEGHVGFKIYNKSALAAYRLLCPLAGNAKNSIPSLTDTYTNFYMPLVFTKGALSVTADNNGKVDLSTLIGSGGGGGDISGLATVATTGDYNDLLNRPVLFSGNYNDLTNKPTLFSGSYGDLTDKPTLFSGDYNDLTNKPTIPTNLSDLSDDSTHRLVTDTEKATWNNKSDFSGSYNDLTNKPTIPTVPAISTNITSDAASDTKTASPKAVKDFVEGKGYLTQHQDISGKADQTDLEALEDRVETLEQSGGSAAQYSYLELVPDLDAYTEAPVGKIVKYIGQTGKYTRGWDYEKVQSGISDVTIPAGTMHTTFKTNSDQTWNDFLANTPQDFYMYETVQGWCSSSASAWCLPNPEVGDYVYKGSRMCPVTAVNGFMVTFVRDGQTLTVNMSENKNLYHFINQDGVSIYSITTPAVGSAASSQFMVFDTGFTAWAGYNTIDTAATEVVIHMGTAQISWEPIFMPTASN